MTSKKENEKVQPTAMQVQVSNDLTVQVIPNNDHEFLMATKEVAAGYGCSEYAIRHIKSYYSSELVEGKHFISAVRISHSEPINKIYWTKRGIVRLGFFIKSERAKAFRDWAEDLIINAIGEPQQTNLFNEPLVKLPKVTKHNRLTPARMVDILADVARIENSELRLSLVEKLTGKGGAL